MCLFSAPSKPYTIHTLSLVRPVNPTVGRVLPLSLFRFHSCSCPLSHLRCCPCFRSRSRRRLCSRPSLVPPLPSALPISVPVPVTVFAPSPSPSLFPFAPSRHASDLVPPSRYNARARAPGVGNGLLAACKRQRWKRQRWKRQRLSAEMMSRADREKEPIVKHNKIAAEDVLLQFPRLDAENRGSISLNCAPILNLLLADGPLSSPSTRFP